MKKLAVLIIATLCCVSAWGQTGTKCSSFDFSYRLEGDVPMTGEGHAVLAEPCYHVTANSMDIWCDGKTKWTVDNESKEVYIEDAPDINSYIKSLNILKDGNTLSGAEVELKDGSKLYLKIENYVALDKPESSFSFKTGSLSKDYVVTDLR